MPQSESVQANPAARLSVTREVYFVWGNHGKSPSQLEDFYTYLQIALEKLGGFQMLFSEDPVPGKLNLVIECFNDDFVAKIREARRQGSRFIFLATEFVTGNTFNDFYHMSSQSLVEAQSGDTEREKSVPRRKKLVLPRFVRALIQQLLPRIFNAKVRGWVLKTLPGPYLAWRNKYYVSFTDPNLTSYAIRDIWKNRFRGFLAAVPEAEAIWCVSPHQIDAYKHILPNSPVDLLPLVSWTDASINKLQGELTKDVDFLFTGTLTPYRKIILDELSARGHRVVVGTATWPQALRDQYIARAKVCLQIRQSATWELPSIMRYHHLLSSGAIVVAEQTTETCMQETYLTMARAEDFVAACERELSLGEFVLRGRHNREQYHQASRAGREQIRQLMSNLLAQ